MTDLLSVYKDTYLAIRAEYEHPDEPILYRGKYYCETLPPKGWDKATYAAYYDEVTRLGDWYPLRSCASWPRSPTPRGTVRPTSKPATASPSPATTYGSQANPSRLCSER